MKKLSLAYFGTPDFASRFLEKLLIDPELKKILDIKFVITQPDKPVGRKQILTPSPVKIMAKKYDLPVYDQNFKNLNIENSLKIKNLKPASRGELKIEDVDLALIYYYGQIIPKKILSLPKYGFWNIHFSALPKYRGPTPATYSLIMGDEKTAVSIVQTDEKLDHGDLIAQQFVKINPKETRIELEERLHNLSFEMFKKIVNSLTRELVNPLINHKQDNNLATYTRFPTKNDGYIPFTILKKALNNEPLRFDELPQLIKDYLIKNSKSKTRNPKQISFENLKLKNWDLIRNSDLEIRNSSKIIFNYFRGLYPWPGIWTQIRPTRSSAEPAKRLKITNLEIIDDRLVIKRVQLEGKKEVDFTTFNRAYKILQGETL